MKDYLPPDIIRGRFTHFAIDSIDFQEDIPNGWNTLHGSVVVIYQTVVEKDATEDLKLVSDEENVEIPDKIYPVLERLLSKSFKLQSPTMSTDIPSALKTLSITNSIVQDLIWMIGGMTNLSQEDKSNQLL